MRTIMRQAIYHSLRRESWLTERRIHVCQTEEAKDSKDCIEDATDKEDKIDTATGGRKG